MKIATIGEIHEEGLKLIPKNKFNVIEIIDTSTEKLKEYLYDVDAIAIRTSNLSSDILAICKNLKIVSRHGVGYDNVDINFLNKRKIPLAITATSNAVSVAEHVIMMMLNLSRKEKSFDRSLKGDFNLENNLLKRGDINKLNYIYIGMQIIHPSLFKGEQRKIFSINRIWDKLIQTDELYGIESNINFLHISTLEIYNHLKKINFKR